MTSSQIKRKTPYMLAGAGRQSLVQESAQISIPWDIEEGVDQSLRGFSGSNLCFG